MGSHNTDSVGQAALYFSFIAAAGMFVLGAVMLRSRLLMTQLQNDVNKLKEKLSEKEAK